MKTASALATSELRYRRLFEAAKDGILILDADTGEIAEANPFMQALLGYSRSELLGKTLWEIGPLKDVCASQEAFRQLQVTEYVRYDNLPLESKDHKRRHVEFVSNVYLVDGKKVIQCNIRDVTERKCANDVIRKVNQDLKSLVAELRRRDREMHLLSEMNELLQCCKAEEEAFQAIGQELGRLFVGQSGSLSVLRVGEQLLEPVACWGPEQPVASGFSLEDCWALRKGQPHEVTGPESTVRCRHFVSFPTSGCLCVPLTVQGETLGMMCLLGGSRWRGNSKAWRLEVAVSAGEMIKRVLSNLRLQEKLGEQANRDPLSGLFNRRYLDDSLSRELSLAQRRGSPLSVAILDIDHFKRFNDTFGHEAGDLVLCDLAQLLVHNLRTSDIACRLGGEEFALVMPDSSLADTRLRVEQICGLAKRLGIVHNGQLLGKVTLSAGIAGSPEHAASAPELLRAADVALYAAKEAGRDQVILFDPAS
jgi:diguanylate cyclase (GGDEF)-like protein/PAS domain S-box-containing protein